MNTWNRPIQGNVKKSKKKGAYASSLLVAFVVVVIIAVVACFVLNRQKELPRRQHDGTKRNIKQVQPADAKPELVQMKTNSSRAVETHSLGKTKAASTSRKEITSQEETDEEIRAKLSGEADIVVNNPADQIIMLLLTGDPDSEIAPLPENAVSEEDFDRSLQKKIVIRDTDIERVKFIKQTLIDARERIKELRKQGLTVNEILNEHHAVCNENVKLHANAAEEAQKIFDSGDLDGAAEYVQKVNEAFKEMGIKELALPQTEEQNEADAAEADAIREESEAIEKEELDKRVKEYKLKNTATRKQGNKQ